MGFQKVAKLSEIADGASKRVTLGSEEVALYNVKGKVCATSNHCLHQGGPLSEGSLEGNVVTCPWHNWKYDVTTGCATFSPEMKLQTYRTQVEGDDILVEV